MVEYMMSSSSVYGSYIPFTPMTVRKEFPETWIWENLTNNGFVNNEKQNLLNGAHNICC